MGIKMWSRQSVIRTAVFLFSLCIVQPVLADETKTDKEDKDDNFQYTTLTTKEGLTFRVPEDMPIERRGGIQAPIPFDEYMYGKFKQMDDRLKDIETMLEDIRKILKSQKQTKAETLVSNKS